MTCTEDYLSTNKIDEQQNLETELTKFGGPIIKLTDETSLIISQNDLGKMNWEKAVEVCKTLTLNNCNDWRLPTREELEILYAQRMILPNYKLDHYWSGTEGENFVAYDLNFEDGKIQTHRKDNKCIALAVRTIKNSEI